MGEWPSISYILISSPILIGIYLLLAEIYNKFPQLGFSVNSKGGTNEDKKPKDIQYTGSFHTISFIQVLTAILIAAYHLNFSIKTWASTLIYPKFGLPDLPSHWYIGFLLNKMMLPFWILGIFHYGIYA